MPRTRPPYPPEFRAEAVRLVKNSGDSIRQVAKDLGISDQILRNWVNHADVDAGRREGITTEVGETASSTGSGNPEKSRGLFRNGDRARVAAVHCFIRPEAAIQSVAYLCRILGVSPAGFYAARGRPPSLRASRTHRDDP